MPDLGTSDDVVLVVGLVVVGLLGALGVVEKLRHTRALEQLDLRISINGSRGKSTVTRLLAGAMAAGGHRPLAKTTGTEPRLIDWRGAETPVERRPEGPNIGEQRWAIRAAVEQGADCAVFECMAVNPEYQQVFHHDLVRSNVVIITNVLDDHLEVMGPTRSDAAQVFADTFPTDGIVVTIPGPFADDLRDAAEARGCSFLLADPAGIDASILRGFDHLVFDEHIALTWAVTDHLGISREVALEGMRAAPADPFATRLLPVGDRGAPALFVNAFPANDPQSTLAVWQHVLDQGHPSEKLVVIMSCRADREHRTRRFVADVLPQLPIDTLVVVGEETRRVTSAVRAGDIEVRELRDHTGGDPHAAVATLDDELRDRVVLAVGNLIGAGKGIVEAFEQRTIEEGGL